MSVEVDFAVLPIEAHKDEILDAIRLHQFLIVLGETGSGKTTKIPQFVLDSNILGGSGCISSGSSSNSNSSINSSTTNNTNSTSIRKIAITQPRRVAAINVAERVAAERGVRLGDEVGYTVRFDDTCTSRTAIRYMTDGILVRECLSDPGNDGLPFYA